MNFKKKKKDKDCSSRKAGQRMREISGEQITNVANVPTFYR